MAALPPKADISRARWDVRFVPKADICSATKWRHSTSRSPSIRRSLANAPLWRRALLSHAIELCLLLVTQGCIEGAELWTQGLDRPNHCVQSIVHGVEPCRRCFSYVRWTGSLQIIGGLC